LERVAAFDLPELKALVKLPDVGMIVVRKDEAALDHLQNLGGKGFCDRGEMGIEGR